MLSTFLILGIRDMFHDTEQLLIGKWSTILPIVKENVDFRSLSELKIILFLKIHVLLILFSFCWSPKSVLTVSDFAVS
jgi:hypothetical protein